MAGYCTVCEFTPGACGFDPMVCDAIRMNSGGGVKKIGIKVVCITADVETWDGSAGYMSQYWAREYGKFKTKAEAVRFIEELCDLHGIR